MQAQTGAIESEPESLTAEALALGVGRRSTEAASGRATESPVDIVPRLRLALQQGQTRNIGKHLVRDATRIAVLVGADLLTFAGMYGLLHAIRDGVAGDGPAAVALWLFPRGFLGVGQYLVALVLSLAIVGAYRAGDARRDGGKLLAGSTLAALLAFWAELWLSPVLPTLGRGAAVALALGIGLTVVRLAVDWVVWRIRPLIGVARTIVVSHYDSDWEDLARLLRGAREFMVVGRIDLPNRPVGGAQAKLSTLGNVIRSTEAETVLLWGNLTADEFAYAVDVALAAGCRLLAGARTSIGDVEPRGVWAGGRQLIELTPRVLRGWQHALKRATDIAGATIGLILLSPIFAAVACAVLLESGGPVFFRQRRIGRGGRTFRIFKFRSMIPDAESRLEELRGASIYGDSRLFKVTDDPRVTRVGRFLRRTSLDELPQLINVLLGDMSLVGPRPPVPSEVDSYDEHHFRRFDVKPGITGPWQVGGRNTITDFDEVVRMESQYVRTWSMMEDMRILLRTIPVVFSGRGAH